MERGEVSLEAEALEQVRQIMRLTDCCTCHSRHPAAQERFDRVEKLLKAIANQRSNGMGVYNEYGKRCAQIKVGDLRLRHFNIGEKCDIPDGVYVTYEGVICIIRGKVAAEFDSLTSKYGGEIPCSEVIDSRNPVAQVVNESK